jgi:hypothetical protein
MKFLKGIYDIIYILINILAMILAFTWPIVFMAF